MEAAIHIPRLYTAKQVAARFGLSPKRIYELGQQGRIRRVEFGRQVRFAEADLLAFIAAGGSSLQEVE
ncbi:hypothetical protein BH23GEM9_BH23GEM9_13820 [soil metagenome]